MAATDSPPEPVSIPEPTDVLAERWSAGRLWRLAALYLDFQLPPLYRTRWWMLAACVISAVILVVVSSISGWELLRTVIAAVD